MKFYVKNRFSGAVIYTAEIDADETTPLSVKLGLAVKIAVKNKINLTWADLKGADFTGANLKGANFTWADLTEANFMGANLTEANLTGADLFNTIGNCNEIKTFQTEFYIVNKIETGLKIGCKFYTTEQWNNFSDNKIEEMDGRKALDFWAKYKPILKAMEWL